MADPEKRLSEQILVLRCQTGDETAFAQLVERYGPRLRYYLQKAFGRRDGAEDAWQDVWFTVFRKVRGLTDPGAFTPWLYQIARRRAYDGQRIHAALDELTLEHREVLVLRFLEDMAYEDIAAVTGCQMGTVKSRLYYAKRALRGILERSVIHE